MKDTDKVTLTVGQLKKLVKESRFFKEADNDFTPDYVKVPFNKSKLMELGFRKIMYHAEDRFWSDAMDEALILCTPYVLMICGNDNGNRYLEISPASDKSASYLMYEPTDENIKNLADTLYPEADIHEGINADYIPL